MGFPERVRDLRLMHGLTQEQLARKLNLCRATLSHYENGLRQADLQTALAISDYFGVSLDFLSGRTNANCYWLQTLDVNDYEVLLVPTTLLRVSPSSRKKQLEVQAL